MPGTLQQMRLTNTKTHIKCSEWKFIHILLASIIITTQRMRQTTRLSELGYYWYGVTAYAAGQEGVTASTDKKVFGNAFFCTIQRKFQRYFGFRFLYTQWQRNEEQSLGKCHLPVRPCQQCLRLAHNTTNSPWFFLAYQKTRAMPDSYTIKNWGQSKVVLKERAANQHTKTCMFALPLSIFRVTL